jgi:hypothetical protein
MFFVPNLILPICLMSILNVFVFLFPSYSGERVGYAITIVAGKLSDDIAKNTAMVSNIVMAYPTLSPLYDGNKNTKTFRMDIRQIGRRLNLISSER